MLDIIFEGVPVNSREGLKTLHDLIGLYLRMTESAGANVRQGEPSLKDEPAKPTTTSRNLPIVL